RQARKDETSSLWENGDYLRHRSDSSLRRQRGARSALVVAKATARSSTRARGSAAICARRLIFHKGGPPDFGAEYIVQASQSKHITLEGCALKSRRREARL